MQEMVDNLDIVHMHGRIYDARWGRMLQADPYIQDAGSQAQNRFAYVINNPLSYTDPTGYEWACVSIPGPGGAENVDCEWYDDDNYWGPGSGGSVGGGGDGGDGSSGGGGTPPPEFKPCPKVPEPPPGVDINDNIDIAKDYWWVNPFASWAFKANVENFGPWDYKRRGDQYQDFGNFNYGATAAAMGMPLYISQNAAGIYHQYFGDDPGSGSGHIVREWPYGDDARDAQQIRSGYRYVRNNCD